MSLFIQRKARGLFTLCAAILIVCAAGACSKQESPKPTPGGEPKPVAGGETLLVFSAASMTNAVEAAGEAWSKKTGVAVEYNFASSSTLARQIESGAGADVYVSANKKWADYLAERNLLSEDGPVIIAGNSLVVIAPSDSPIEKMEIGEGFNFAGAFEGRLALGDPEHVPAGMYAKDALTHFGWFEAIEPRMLPCPDVRAALAAVESGEVGLGIVYGTDAAIAENVKIVGVFPGESHKAIVYPAAACAGSKPNAVDFRQFLLSEEARAIFADFGFTPPPAK